MYVCTYMYVYICIHIYVAPKDKLGKKDSKKQKGKEYYDISYIVYISAECVPISLSMMCVPMSLSMMRVHL